MTTSNLKLKGIALPVEHGSWGLVFEPILLGLLVAPSWGGFWLAFAAFAAFLLRQPTKIMLIDWRRKRVARTRIAERFVLLYSLLMIGGLGAAIALGGYYPLWAWGAALPFLLIFLYYDWHNQSRSWQAELAGPTAFAWVAVSIALADGWTWRLAIPLALVLISRAIPSILFIRARIRLDKGKLYHLAPVLWAHGIALAVIMALIGGGLLTKLAIWPFLALTLRAVFGLSTYRRAVPVKVVGFSELGWGMATILCVAWGYWWPG